MVRFIAGVITGNVISFVLFWTFERTYSVGILNFNMQAIGIYFLGFFFRDSNFKNEKYFFFSNWLKKRKNDYGFNIELLMNVTVFHLVEFLYPSSIPKKKNKIVVVSSDNFILFKIWDFITFSSTQISNNIICIRI